MSQSAKTVDDPERKPTSREKADWVERFLGVNVSVIDRLDLADTTSAESAQRAVPMILGQVRDIMAPLSAAPKANVRELQEALAKAREIQTALTGKTPTPQAIVPIRRNVGELKGLVDGALAVITDLDRRRGELIRDASLLAVPGEADASAEGEPIGRFKERQAAVAGAFADGILTTEKVRTAEAALAAARDAVNEIANAAQVRLRAQLVKLIEQAAALKYSADADSSAESGPIGTFTAQQKAVSVAQAKDKLTGEDIAQAGIALAAAKAAVAEIAAAVEQRHAEWAKRIVQKADELIARYKEKGLDPTVWDKPRSTREAIDRELQPS